MNCPPCSENCTLKGSVLLTPLVGATKTSQNMVEEKLFFHVAVELLWQD